MKFWDTSALLPLVISEPRSADCLAVARQDTQIVYWWSTPLEIASALARRLRDGSLDAAQVALVRQNADRLLQRSSEMAPSVRIRTLALQLIRLHPLRAADATQLAAAMHAFGPMPAITEFVCIDERLRAAALAEGAIVLP